MRPINRTSRTPCRSLGRLVPGLSASTGSSRRAGGFTLIELLIVVAILGLLATILMPKMLDGLHKGRQKRTMADIRTTGTAMMAWLTDEISAAAAGSSVVDLSKYYQIPRAQLRDLLVPTYLQEVPVLDGWGYEYDYFLETELFGTSGEFATLAIRSPGRDGASEGLTYNWGPFSPTDYDRDIVWKDGFFVAFPSADYSPGSGDDDIGSDDDFGDDEPQGCNQGVGNGSEGCDPGNSNHMTPSNDEGSGTGPGNPGKRGGPGGRG